MMLKVGITGGIGSGKTIVCRIFETLGAPVYYADLEARRIMRDDIAVRELILQLLGAEAYKGQELNRSYIASRIFGDRDLLRQVNSIVHPAVHNDFLHWVSTVTEASYVIKEAAILFESGSASDLDHTVLVYASEETRIQRVIERDGTDPEQVRQRMLNQMPDEEKKKLADYVILNDLNKMLIPQVVDIHVEFLNKLK